MTYHEPNSYAIVELHNAVVVNQLGYCLAQTLNLSIEIGGDGNVGEQQCEGRRRSKPVCVLLLLVDFIATFSLANWFRKKISTFAGSWL